MPNDYDPMETTDKEFYNIINQEDWDIKLVDREETEFYPQIVEFHMPGPTVGIFIKVSMAMQTQEDHDNFTNFINSLTVFMVEEDERYNGS